MTHSLQLDGFSIPVVSYDNDAIIRGENQLAVQIIGATQIGKTLADFLGRLPESHTTHILFEQEGHTILEIAETVDSHQMSGVMQIEHELVTPLDQMRSRMHKLNISSEEQKFFDEIFLSMRKKIQSITFEMGFRKGIIPVHIKENLNLTKTLTNLADAVNQHYGQSIVSLQLQDPYIFADFDENKLLHAMLQLISNAVKMSLPDKLPAITITLSQNKKGTVIAVSDQGVGFPDGDPNLLTEAYYQADNTYTKSVPGLGVGLYLVKQIAALHRGTLELGNNETGGALVTITLPPNESSKGPGTLGSTPIQFSLSEVKDRTAFMLVDDPIKY